MVILLKSYTSKSGVKILKNATQPKSLKSILGTIPSAGSVKGGPSRQMAYGILVSLMITNAIIILKSSRISFWSVVVPLIMMDVTFERIF